MRIERDRLRLYALAIITGIVAEVGLVLAIQRSGTEALALLLFGEAVILGLVFGARPGMLAAVLPLVLLYPVALVVDDIANPVAVLSYLLFVVIILAFCAGMAGAMRDRYGRRSSPPPAS